MRAKVTAVYVILPDTNRHFRFGVAPDHPEVKNCTNSFSKLMTERNCSFYGNISLGKDISVEELRQYYHSVVVVSFYLGVVVSYLIKFFTSIS